MTRDFTLSFARLVDRDPPRLAKKTACCIWFASDDGRTDARARTHAHVGWEDLARHFSKMARSLNMLNHIETFAIVATGVTYMTLNERFMRLQPSPTKRSMIHSSLFFCRLACPILTVIVNVCRFLCAEAEASLNGVGSLTSMKSCWILGWYYGEWDILEAFFFRNAQSQGLLVYVYSSLAD